MELSLGIIFCNCGAGVSILHHFAIDKRHFVIISHVTMAKDSSHSHKKLLVTNGEMAKNINATVKCGYINNNEALIDFKALIRGAVWYRRNVFCEITIDANNEMAQSHHSFSVVGTISCEGNRDISNNRTIVTGNIIIRLPAFARAVNKIRAFSVQ